MKFRPCIDLHNGQVKQIVGGTLDEAAPSRLATNFASDLPSSYYATLYQRDGLTGGHVIKLGPGCDEAAREALAAYPGGMQIGGGIDAANALSWLEQGASAVIVTSFVFQNGQILEERLRELVSSVGAAHLVLDLSCRRRGSEFFIVTDRWQKFTEVTVSAQSLEYFSRFCFEFLVHGVDVEGRCAGVDLDLVELLGRFSPIPTTYAGGVRNLADLELVRQHGQGRLDVTVGSALDLFGGTGMTYQEAVAFNRAQGF